MFAGVLPSIECSTDYLRFACAPEKRCSTNNRVQFAKETILTLLVNNHEEWTQYKQGRWDSTGAVTTSDGRRAS